MPSTPSFELAGIGARAWAFIIDLNIRVCIVLIWIFGYLALYTQTIMTWSFETYQFQEIYSETPSNVGLIALLIYFLYHPIIEVLTSGSTPGKYYAKIKITNKDGQRASILQLLVRNLLRIIDFLPGNYGLAVFTGMMNKKQLRLGDLAAGTIVIYHD